MRSLTSIVLDCDNVKNKQLSKEFEDYKIKFKP